MKDIITKIRLATFETSLNPNDPASDYKEKLKALRDLQMDPIAADDLEIKKAIMQRKADLEKEAKEKGITSDTKEDLFQIGDDFGISFSEDLEIETEIVDMLEDGIVVNLDEEAIAFLEQHGVSFQEVQINEEKEKGLDGKACWKGYRYAGTKMKGGKRVDDCVKTEDHAADPDAEHNKGEYDREGDMAKDDLRTINDAARELYDIIQSEENLPEWVQAKLVKAADYIDTVRDYLKANKEVDEAKYQGREVPLGKPMKGDVKKSKVYVKNPQGNVVKVNFGDKKMRIKKSNPNRRKSFRARHNCSNPGPRHKARYWSCRAW